MTYDVIVLGAGNGGLAVAGAARAAGWSTLVVEARDVGGTCPLRGCVPKKVLVAAADALDQIARAEAHGISVGDVSLDWGALMARERSFVEEVADQMASGLTKKGAELVRGRASFVDRNAVEVDSTRYEGRHIVVATGSSPRKLPIEGAEHLATSEDFLQMSELPASAVFVGGGVVAMEFSHILARAGSQAHLLEIAPRTLPAHDADAVRVLQEVSRDVGIDLSCQVQIQRIEATDDGRYTVHYQRDGQDHTLTADRVFNGAGRVANLADLNLAAAGIAFDGRGVSLDAHLRSTDNAHVWFAGDAVTSTPQLSPAATWEGRLVGHNLLHPDDLRTVDHSTAPSVVFTLPPLATVGLTEERARQAGHAVDVKTHRMDSWRTARMYAERAAFAKVVLEEGTGRILGATLLGYGGQESIHTIAMAMRAGWTATQLQEAQFAYPTFTNDLKFLF
ncbi:MAG: NAD(P)/FAD-dependent oxidoreductase [Myxococcales bacterium]|nr:NAD(P)/FAD-dependent oxidoreductase [Myxococcales bacterium]